MKASAAAADKAAKNSLPPPPSQSLSQLQSSIETLPDAELTSASADDMLTEIDETQNEGTVQRITLPIPEACDSRVVLLFGKFADAETSQAMWAVGYNISSTIGGDSDCLECEPNTDPNDLSSAGYANLVDAIQEACSAAQTAIIEINDGSAAGKAFDLHQAIGSWAKEVDSDVTESIFDDPSNPEGFYNGMPEDPPEVAVAKATGPLGNHPQNQEENRMAVAKKKRKQRQIATTEQATVDSETDVAMFDVSETTLRKMQRDICYAGQLLANIQGWIDTALGKVNPANLKSGKKSTDAAGEVETVAPAATEVEAPNPPVNTPAGSKPEGKQAMAASASADSSGPDDPAARACTDKANAEASLSAAGGDTPPPEYLGSDGSSLLASVIPAITPVALKILLDNGIDTISAYRSLPTAKHPSKGNLQNKSGKYKFTDTRIKKTEQAIAEYLMSRPELNAGGQKENSPFVSGMVDVPAIAPIVPVVPVAPLPAQKPLFQDAPGGDVFEL